MIKKALSQILNEKQVEALKPKMWWVASRENIPYMMKFAICEEAILLELTNFQSVWALQTNHKALLEDKKKYANSLEIKDIKDLLSLFEGLLSQSDPLAQYSFKEDFQGEMEFTFKKRINIYDFEWVFKLKKVNQAPIQLICKEIINPLAFALECQCKRVELMKKRFEQIEKEYVRKMSEMERALYKSPLQDDEQDWKVLMGKPDEKLLNFIKIDNVSSFFIRNYFQEEKKKEHSLPFTDSNNKMLITRTTANNYQLNQHELKRELQLESNRARRHKKIDFI